MSTPTREHLQLLENRREQIRADAERVLIRARDAGRSELDRAEADQIRQLTADLRSMDGQITEYRAEVERSTLPDHYAHLGDLSRRTLSSAGRLAPLALAPEALRDAYEKARKGESAVMRAFTSASPLIPGELYGIPLFPQHENRLVDRLVGYALEAPSLEYVQVTTISGAAQIVGEGQPKPEIQMPPTKLEVKALKLACHAGVSWESIADFDGFTSAVQNELLKQLVDLENAELWGGDATAGGLNSLTKTAGILTFPAGQPGNPPNNYDDFAGAIAALRTGSALAVPDLILIHPDTFAAVRTQKDSQGRYLASVDPSSGQTDTIWGVEVLQSTAFASGEAVVLDSKLMGKVVVRESLTLRTGFAGDDFTSNVVRFIGEERMNLAVERPAAICHLTGLPDSAPTVATTAKTKASK